MAFLKRHGFFKIGTITPRLRDSGIRFKLSMQVYIQAKCLRKICELPHFRCSIVIPSKPGEQLPRKVRIILFTISGDILKSLAFDWHEENLSLIKSTTCFCSFDRLKV